MGIGFEIYSWPGSAPVKLPIPPRLASWDARTHPAQERLREYLDALARLVDVSSLPDRGLVLALSVGLPAGTDLLRGGDLDNYLYPVAQYLGGSRFLAAWAEKRISSSTVAVADAEFADARELAAGGWQHARVRTRSSATTAAWKQEIGDQLTDCEPAPPGALEVQLAFRVGPTRNWINLWKPALDSLEQILGRGPRRFHPKDDRITRLGLHRSLDASLGYDVEIGIWWRQAR